MSKESRQIVWGDTKKVLDITEVYLSNCVADGNGNLNDISWLLEDDEFVKSVLFGASMFFFEHDFVYWLSKFISHMSKDSKFFAERVSLIRIKKHRPEVYNTWINGGYDD